MHYVKEGGWRNDGYGCYGITPSGSLSLCDDAVSIFEEDFKNVACRQLCFSELSIIVNFEIILFVLKSEHHRGELSR